MPLLKKRPFPHVATPEDLRPDEEVWQVRATKEIFRSYPEYLERMNLYRKRVWTCRVTGKMHLTYEEALVSEIKASEKLLLQFPQIFMGHVLHMVQFSTLKMNDLVTMIVENFSDTFVQGEELLGRSENSSRPCKVMKVLSCDGGPSYEVGWLSESGEVICTSIEEKNKLIRKKFPFSRGLLKLFISESTSQNSPWLIHDKLAKKYGVSTKSSSEQREMQPEIEEIEYPIEDLLVKPSAEDPPLTNRPVPSSKFRVPLCDVGNLIMIWDFFSHFGKVLHLSPFSLNEFENAIVYDGITNLIIEAHASILTLLINDHGDYYTFIQNKKREEMIPLKAWAEYLCDFLELENETKYKDHFGKVKSGNYGMIRVQVKLEILGGLLDWAISTEAIRGQVNGCIEQQQVLVASKREEHLEEVRKKREEKLMKEAEASELVEHDDSKDINLSPDDGNTRVASSEIKHADKSGSKLQVLASRRALMVKNLETKFAVEREKEISRVEELKRLREENRIRAQEARERKLKEQRLEQFESKMEKLHIRTKSLGEDRDRNTYWFFKQEGMLFVESADHDSWSFYSSKEELDVLMSSLNPKGVRELSLQRHLQKHYLKICSAFQKRSKELAQQTGSEDAANLRRYTLRVSALPKDGNKVPSFLRYRNKWRR